MLKDNDTDFPEPDAEAEHYRKIRTLHLAQTRKAPDNICPVASACRDVFSAYINRCITSSSTARLGLTRSSANVPSGSSTRFSISVKLGFCVSM